MVSTRKIKLLLGDPRPTFRAGLKLLLSREKDLSLVGEAEAADQVVRKVTDLKPQVILMHSSFSVSNGRNVLLQLQRNHSRIRVLVLVDTEADENEIRALRVASVQVVPRQAAFQQIAQWIRQVDTNGSGPAAAGAGKGDAAMTTGEEPADSSPLSARERQVVELVSQGFKNREIAQRMFISEQTVKNHLHNIFDKLGVSDRLELALYAIHKQLQGGY